MSLRYSRVSWLRKWQAIKPFHIGVELRQGCVLFVFFFIIYMNWIDKCNQADGFTTMEIEKSVEKQDCLLGG